MSRIAVVTADTLAPAMAGPAIRAFHLSAALSAEHEVRLVSTGLAELTDPRFSIELADERGLRRLAEWCDILLFQGWILAGRNDLARDDRILIADIYDPMHLEQLEQGRDRGEDVRRIAVRNATGVLNEQMLRADFLLCASAKQRDFWLGALASIGRVNPPTYDADGSLGELLAVVPFGVVDEAPVQQRHGLRGVIPGIGATDRIVIWGGGIYNWFDPLTLIRAIDRVRKDVPEVRLVFMGLRHPNPDIPEMRMAVAAQALADGLGLTDSHVFFNEGWVPYDDRHNLLLDADIGVSTHHEHLETEFSFRTRMLDYFWCSLPVITTSGDSMSDLVERGGAGVVVPPEDVDALVDALMTLLTDDDRRLACREGSARLAAELRWSRVVEPLLRFCRRPATAPDRADPEIGAELLGMHFGKMRSGGLRHDLRLIRKYLHEGGVRKLVVQVRSRLGHLGRAVRKRLPGASPGR